MTEGRSRIPSRSEFQESDLPPFLLPALGGGRLEIRLDGRTYSVRGGPVGEGAEAVRILVLLDITERTRMEAQLREQVAFTSALVGLAQAALAGGGLKEVVQAIGERLLRLFGAEVGAVVDLLDGGQVLWVSPLGVPLPEKQSLEVFPVRGLFRQALSEGRPLGLEEIPPEGCALAGDPGVRSAPVLSLLAEGFKGGILLGYTRPRSFSSRLLSWLSQVQSLVALSLEKAHLLQEREAGEARLMALFAYSQDVVYVLDGERYIRWVSESACTVLGYDPRGNGLDWWGVLRSVNSQTG